MSRCFWKWIYMGQRADEVVAAEGVLWSNKLLMV